MWYLRVTNNEDPVLHHLHNEPWKITKLQKLQGSEERWYVQISAKIKGKIKPTVLKHELELL